jgi:uncharacterized protein YbbC (DUF1343 family)
MTILEIKNYSTELKNFTQLCSMKQMLITLLSWIVLCSQITCAQTQKSTSNNIAIETGAAQVSSYLPLLKGKSVGVFANQTAVIGKTHLVDSLVRLGVNVKVIFGPEHGFRGKADAGEHVDNNIDAKTGIQVISLYGNHKKPTATDVKNIDILIFDIQDVGVRFYTFISSLEYMMEAAIENNKPLIILDRPNPNGFYVDGPVLENEFKSFVGMQPIPVVYGMTLGEYAKMLLGEKWLSPSTMKLYKPDLINVIALKNYDHNTMYTLPVHPSPNLKEMESIYIYPSTCFFEGTILSEGRGTEKPFQIFGHPNLPKTLFSFTPKPNDGAKSSKCFNQTCYGWNLSGTKESVLKKLNKQIQIKYLIEAYKLFPGKDSFFLKNNFFNKLAGNDKLMQQIKDGKSESEIRKSWESELIKFKAIRKKYLLYKDFN